MTSLNHVFRTIWSEALGAWIAVSEITKSRGRRSASSLIRAITAGSSFGRNALGIRLKPALFAVACCFAVNALANPIGGTVVNGQASFSNAGNTLTVTNTPGTIINWQGFSIGANEATHFAQQSASSTVLNRVVTNTPSVILGKLSSNGQVYLVNANGIMFGAGSTVDVAGLVATSLNLSDADFLAGNHHYASIPGAANVNNAGNINAQQNGFIYLIAPNVENTGIIHAPDGEILLAAGSEVQLVNGLDPNLRVSITAPAGDATNVGQLIAESGSLGLFGTMVKNSGVVSADSATMQGGKIVFKASQRSEISGTVSANGMTGGTIEALGNQVGIMDGATVTANGAGGGGTILIGGDYQGKNPGVPNAQVTYVAPTANIQADATDSGNGGKVIVWADDTTRFYGKISAQGGTNGGNGGFVETSGHNYLDFQGVVNTGATQGLAGTLLLDPADITIDNSANTWNGTIIGGVFSGGISATFPSYITWATLNAQTGNVEINTTGGTGSVGTGIVNINASGSITGPSSLTILANSNINIASNVAVNSTGDINLIAGWNNSGMAVTPGTGTITLNPGSSISTTGNIWLNAGNSVVEAIGGTTATITANTLSIGNTNGGSLPGGISLTGANMVNTLAVQMDSTTGSLAFTNGKALTIGTGLYFSGIVATGNPSALGITTTAGDITIAQNISSAGAVTLNSAGAILESGAGAISSSGLTTSSAGGTTLNGANTVTSFSATNMTSGNISLTNTAATLTALGINNTAAGGSVAVNNAGSISIMGTIAAAGGGAINLTSLGSIAETSTGQISTTGLLTTSSVSGQNLVPIGVNTVGSLNVSNSKTGTVSFGNVGTTLTVTGVSQIGSGAVTIINSGDISTTGAITTSGTAATSVNLVSSGNVTVGNSVTGTGGGAVNLTLVHGGTGNATLAGNLSLAGGNLDAQNINGVGTGTLNISAGAISNSGALTATTLVNNGSIFLSGTGNSVIGTLTQNGQLDIAAGGMLVAPSFTNTGTLSGGGTLNLGAGTVTNNGIIAPGGAGTAGTLSITGNLVMGSTGIVNVDITNSAAGNYDTLNVSGTASLTGGTMNIVGGAIGTYTVLNAAGGLGGTKFAAINSGVFSVGPTYTANALALDLSINPVLLSQLVNAGQIAPVMPDGYDKKNEKATQDSSGAPVAVCQ